jgi:hypothetical protein
MIAIMLVLLLLLWLVLLLLFAECPARQSVKAFGISTENREVSGRWRTAQQPLVISAPPLGGQERKREDLKGSS